MNQPHHAAAVVTAAGLSSRMGAFKPLLPLGNESISRLLIRRLKEAGVSPVLVVTGHRAGELENHLSSPEVRFVHNAEYRTTDMFTSLSLGLSTLWKQQECISDKIFLTPADIPCILPSTLRLLMEADADAAIPVCSGRKGHPVCISRNLIPGILSYHGENGLKGALRTLSARTSFIETEDPGILADADTPKEYEALRQLFSQMEKAESGIRKEEFHEPHFI